jgi:hypothetical protein
MSRTHRFGKGGNVRIRFPSLTTKPVPRTNARGGPLQRRLRVQLGGQGASRSASWRRYQAIQFGRVIASTSAKAKPSGRGTAWRPCATPWPRSDEHAVHPAAAAGAV